jgi:predicted NAD/FAD-binding protein
MIPAINYNQMREFSMKHLITVICVICSLLTGTAYADKIAIIGGGASGLISAWLLEKNHEVTLYESQGRLGGHANSIEINVDGSPVVIEAGAEYFNVTFYPMFTRILRHYNIPLKYFNLVTNFYETNGKRQIILPPYHDGKIEWVSLTPANISRSVQLHNVIQEGRKLLTSHDTNVTLEEFIATLKVSNDFKANLLYPFMAAAWGISLNDVRDFSAYNVINYLAKGSDTKKDQWLEVEGGTQKYIDAVYHSLENAQVKLNAHVTQIGRNGSRYTVKTADGVVQEYDQLIFATGANVASELLGTLPETTDISILLSKIRYYDTKIAIHGDPRFMPPNKKDWRIINIRYDGYHSAMTMYKNWKSSKPIFKTWLTYDVRSPSDKNGPMPENIYAMVYYKHPIVDKNYFEVQSAIRQLQGKRQLWFVGNWTYDSDSHESAISSAVEIAKKLASDSERLRILQGTHNRNITNEQSHP